MFIHHDLFQRGCYVEELVVFVVLMSLLQLFSVEVHCLFASAERHTCGSTITVWVAGCEAYGIGVDEGNTACQHRGMVFSFTCLLL